MLNPAPCRHVPEFARPKHRAGAHAITMLYGTFKNVGYDLHVPVAVHPESFAGLNPVLIDDSQRPEAHLGRVVVGVEGKRVPRIEPVILGMASVGCPPHTDISGIDFQFAYGLHFIFSSNMSISFVFGPRCSGLFQQAT